MISPLKPRARLKQMIFSSLLMFLKVGLVLIDAHSRQGSRDHRSERTQIIFGDDFTLRIQRHGGADGINGC